MFKIKDEKDKIYDIKGHTIFEMLHEGTYKELEVDINKEQELLKYKITHRNQRTKSDFLTKWTLLPSSKKGDIPTFYAELKLFKQYNIEEML